MWGNRTEHFCLNLIKNKFCEKSNYSVTVILCLCYSSLLQYRWRRWWGSNLRWCQGDETPGEGNGAKIWGGGGVWPSQVFKATLCTLNLQKMTVCMPMFKNQMIWVIIAFIHTAQQSETVMSRCFRWFRKIQTIKAHILIYGSSLLSLHFSITTEHQYIYWSLYLFW